MTKQRLAMVLLWLSCAPAIADDYLGQLNANPYDPNSTSNRFGAGSPYNADSVNNRFGRYGSPYSNQSATNPYATDAPKLYDSNGEFRGKLSSNPYDPDSISNPFGRYGSRYSAESVNNPFGAGSRYSSDSPTNPYGKGLSVFGESGDDRVTAPRAPTSGYGNPSLPTLPTYGQPTNPYRSPGLERSSVSGASPYQFQAPTKPLAAPPQPSRSSGIRQPWTSPIRQ